MWLYTLSRRSRSASKMALVLGENEAAAEYKKVADQYEDQDQ